MANDTILTIIGNLVAPPELRFTQSGVAVASFTVASTPRAFDKQSNEWKDGETLFMRCSAWREMAENIGESSLEKGSRVVVQGRLKSRSYTDREGQARTSIELDVEEVGPSLRYATAKPVKVQRGQGGGFGGSQGGAPQGGQSSPPPANDPWQGGGQAPQGYGGGSANAFSDPPFAA